MADQFELREERSEFSALDNVIRGPAGPAGPQGPQGEPGVDGTVSFDELTPAQRESLRGPQGIQGEKGDKGDTGETGPQGIQGIQGVQGETGPQGPKGDKGDTGADGAKGDTGSQGPKGDKGDTGDDGYSPAITISTITGGHSVSITDKTHPTGQSFTVMDGADGADGATGPGVPAGGTDGDVLVKNGATDYAAKWTNTPPQMGSLAYINIGATADKPYQPGEYLVHNGQLYKVGDTAIGQGETLNPGQGGNIGEISITDNLPKILYYSGGPVSVSADTVTWFDAGFTLPKGDYLVFASVIPQSTVPSATGQCRIQYSINGSSGVEAINKTGLGNGNGIQGFAYTNNYFRIGTYLTGTTDAVYFTYNAYVLRVGNKS